MCYIQDENDPVIISTEATTGNASVATAEGSYGMVMYSLPLLA